MIILSDLRDYTQTLYLFLYQRLSQNYITDCNGDNFSDKTVVLVFTVFFRNYLI